MVTPRAARRLGEARLARWLKTKGVRKSDAIAGRVIAAAKVQRHELPAAEAKAALVAEIASEILRACLVSNRVRLEEAKSASLPQETA